MLLGRVAILALLAASLCVGLTACSDPGVVTVRVQLHQAPSNDSQVLASIPRGSAVKVRNCTNGWCNVSWNGHDGYIVTKDIRLGVAAASIPQKDGSDSDDIENDDNISTPESGDTAAPM
jgi:uncharacterized protein YraI